MLKSSGICRRMDKLGRIVIPAEARYQLGWEEKELVEISQFGRYILVRSRNPRTTNPVPQTENANPAFLQDIIALASNLRDEDMLLSLEFLHRLSQNG